MRSFKILDAKTNSDISDFSDNFSDISENLHATFQDMESLRRNERRRENLQHIGFAAWRVLQNARKAAIARRNDADAEMRGQRSVQKAKSAEKRLERAFMETFDTTRRPGASATVEERDDLKPHAVRKRSRIKRSTGSEI